MVILENLIILVIVGLAIGYLIKLVYNQFTSENPGCASCAGDCSTIAKNEKIVSDFPKISKN